jgi:hypothetical protein
VQRKSQAKNEVEQWKILGRQTFSQARTTLVKAKSGENGLGRHQLLHEGHKADALLVDPKWRQIGRLENPMRAKKRNPVGSRSQDQNRSL